MLTWAVFIASSKADWVLGVVRLISSTKTMLAKTGPWRNEKQCCSVS